MKINIKLIKNSIIDKISNLYFAPIMYIIIILMAEFFRRFESSTTSFCILALFTMSFYFTFIMIAFESIAEASAHKRSNAGAVIRICSSVVVTLIFFSILYFYIYLMNPSSFNGNMGETYLSQFFTFLYFSFITFSTIGYGDIYPVSMISRGVVILEVIYQFIIIVLVISQFTIFHNQFKKQSPFEVNNKNDDA